MIRLGLVGVGRWGRRFLDTVARRDDTRVVAFARGSGTEPVALEGAIQLPSWHDLLACAQRSELDGIIVATTPANQAEVALAALKAGVPALVEKPLGLGQAGVRALGEHAATLDQLAPLVIDHVHLWAPAFRALQGLVADGVVKAIVSEGWGAGPVRGWSSLFDYGPHDVAMCLALLGCTAPVEVESMQATALPAAHPGGELFEARFTVSGAAVILRVGNGGASKRRRLEVMMKGGRVLVYDDLQPNPGKLLDGGAPVVISTQMPLDLVVSDFLERIGRWKNGQYRGAETRQTVTFCEAVAALLARIELGLGGPVP